MSRIHASPVGLEFEAMSQVVRTGDTVWVSGLVAWHDGAVDGPGDSHAQGRRIVDNLRRCLATVGATTADVVRLTCYVTAAEHYDGWRAAKREAWADGPYPAATTVIVAGLLHPDFLIEVSAVAVVESP
jgi:enamine deaminase RidA (YjgF/YER057c/UK114 family)